MEEVKITIKRVSVQKFDFRNNTLYLNVDYLEDDKPQKYSNKVSLEESGLLFVKDAIFKMRNEARMRHGIDGKDVFGNYGKVVINEKEEGQTEEKLIEAINRIRDKAKDFKRVKSAENYMNRLFEINNLKIDFK